MSYMERHGGDYTSTQAPGTFLKSFGHSRPQGEFPGIRQPISGSTYLQSPHLYCPSNLIFFDCEAVPTGLAYGSGLTHSDANVSTCGEDLDPEANART